MKETQSRVKKKSEERDDLETIKAAAWAVFQHNNGGGSNSTRHPGAVFVQQGPTRFKIEAQLKQELERRSIAKEASLPSWDASRSTLFDKYELDSVFKHLDLAFQSADTPHKVSFDGPEYDDETTAEPHHLDQRSRNGYSVSEQGGPKQGNWLETVDQSQRFRGSYLESVDESLHEEPLKPKLMMNLELYDELCKDVQEVVPQGKVFKAMQFMHAPNRWSVLNGQRCSFDTSPEKESKQSRKSKLLAIFRSKSGKDARIVPDDLKRRKPLRRSGELDVVADPHDSDSSDEYPSKGAYTSGLRIFSRAVRLSSDMSNPNPEEGLRDHLRHGHLTYGRGAAAPALPTGRRKGTYSLNVTSPVQTPRRSMLDGSREDFDLDDTRQVHHEYHHHHHHHHHHIALPDDDYELTVQDIVRRVSRKSFEEAAHRVSFEETAGLKAPRNSLESPFFNTPTPGSKLFL